MRAKRRGQPLVLLPSPGWLQSNFVRLFQTIYLTRNLSRHGPVV